MGTEEKRKAAEAVFVQYDTHGRGELTPVQMQILHGDMRIGGISFPQVLASMKYVCATDNCSPGELFDLLQEMDRRYFLLQSFRWDFSFLDRQQGDAITVEQAKWMMQSVHGRYFSPGKWSSFIKSRAVPTSKIAFAEIEVMLCDIPSKKSLEEEEMEKERILKEKKRRQEEKEREILLERHRMRQEAEKARRRRQADREKAEQERINKEKEKDEEREAEFKQKKKEEEEELERIRKLEEEQRRQKELEDDSYKDAEIHKEAAERAVQETDDELARLNKEKETADVNRRKQLEDEEKRLSGVRRDHHHRRIRYQLKVAIKSRDKYQLEFSVTEFKEAKLSDDDMDLAKATRLLQQLAARDGLTKAMSKREITDLERAMTFVRQNGFETSLAKEMRAASNLLSRLRRLERIRHEILELKQATVAEIRSYQSPPPIVHTVMTVTFLLLGHKEKETKDWKEVQALVGRTGKESLKRRCLSLEASTLQETIARRAQRLLGNLELDEVRDISAGAATFFVWATAMIEEALSSETSELDTQSEAQT
ncbi:trichohyalin-like [Plakobranchus ocellatus]|uniref:Trichohyalin-like n=1 Tax=Plakobranchus ocellatus TaxID=259542 RepID=A0AAV4CYT7_9GAST|nr:trichohyalin-like [Plakobranchus ocellatus]